MPVAGNNVECIPMQVVNGQLVEYAKTRIPSHAAQDAPAALEALRRGDKAFVRMYGHNVPDVRSAWRTRSEEASE